MADPPIPLAPLPPAVAQVLEARGARQVNLYHALSNAPKIAEAWLGYLWALRDECTVSRALRELAILRTAVRAASPYEWAHHEQMAAAAGVTQAAVAAVRRWPDGGSALTSDESLVLALTDALCDGAVPDDVLEAAVGAFGLQGYVELVATIAAYVMVPRVLDALRVPLEDGIGPVVLDEHRYTVAP